MKNKSIIPGLDKKSIVIILIVAVIAGAAGFVLAYFTAERPTYNDLPDDVKRTLQQKAAL